MSETQIFSSIHRNGIVSTQLDSLIPANKISNLPQGWFLEAISDNLDEYIE